MLRGAAQPSRPCPHPRAPRPWEGRRRGSPAPTQKVLGTRGSDLPRRHSEHHRGCAGRLVGPWAGLPTHHVCTPRKHGRLPRAGSRCSPLPLCASGRLRGAVSTAGKRGRRASGSCESDGLGLPELPSLPLTRILSPQVHVVLLEPQGLAAWRGGGRGWPGGPETGSLSPVTHRSPPGRSPSPGGPSGVPAQSSPRGGQARTRPHWIPS